MEGILERKDAGDWIYRGEGAVNLVLAYIGSSPTFVGKVLRIQKSVRNGFKCEDGPSALTMHECLLWEDTKDLVSAPTKEIAEQQYVQHVMIPLLGPEHVDAGEPVKVESQLANVGEDIVIHMGSCESWFKHLRRCLIGRFGDMNTPILDKLKIQKWALKKWGIQAGLKVLDLNVAWFLFELPSVEEASRRNWSFEGLPVTLQPWSPSGCCSGLKEDGLIWIRLMGLPAFLWSTEVFRALGKRCGHFVKTNEATAERRYLKWTRVRVSSEFLESVEDNVRCDRPAWRVDAAKVNTLCDSALLISDHSVIPNSHGILERQICVSVEIKPKCGFLPLSRFIAEGNAIKRKITRFRMHQSLKLHQGEISEISEYNPLYMFSGSKDRVHKAIKALFVTPQNNFRVFLNGSLILGGSGGVAESTSCVIGEAFEDVLKCVIRADDGLRTTNFLELVAEAVFESGLLDRVLKVQKLDLYDIEGAIHVYYDLVSQPCMVCKDLGEDKLSGRYSSLHSLPLNESLNIVRDYLIAATAKDLSMMIAFRPRENGDLGSPYSIVFLKSTGQSFDYKASFIDLDMKPLKRMEHYYKLDQKIVSYYTQMLKMEHQLDKKAARIKVNGTLN
ncbi:hypothetical protein F0562_036025 [Nyssa sinensis]|uniref:Inositol-pentakisphosphate 2-kinase n=1 Tax=Nyssa sinensis TaxID=561372 RepID=A0A5J5ADF4_9ASTE|nr:hypothetical protein F0562_036025 [Nyssa sinensis]